MVRTSSFFVALLALTNLSPIAHAAQPKCVAALVAAGDPANSKLLVWRKNTSHPIPGKGFVKTTKAREQEIKDSEDSQLGIIKNDEATPVVDIIPAPGITLNDLDRKPQDSYGVSPWDLEVTGLKSTNGILYATLVLPVSGHEGIVNATNWAKSDNILVELIDDSTGKRTVLANHVKSLDFVTKIDVEIPLIKGRELKVEYSRPPGNGVGGFSNGRTIYLTWDGK